MSRKRNRGYRIREAIQVGSLVFLLTWTRNSVVSHVLQQSKRSLGLHRQETTQKFEEIHILFVTVLNHF